MLPPEMLPVTAKLVSVPTEVILPCAAVDNVPEIPVTLILPAVMLPVTETVVPVCVVALTLAPPKMLPPEMLPVTAKLVSVPTEVTCVWLALTLNVVPVNVNPVPALYVPAPEN